MDLYDLIETLPTGPIIFHARFFRFLTRRDEGLLGVWAATEKNAPGPTVYGISVRNMTMPDDTFPAIGLTSHRQSGSG